MSVSISTARHQLLDSLETYRQALEANRSAGPGKAAGDSHEVDGDHAAGAACGIDDADGATQDTANPTPLDDDAGGTSSTTQSEQMQAMMEFERMFLEAWIAMKSQESQQGGQNPPNLLPLDDDPFCPVSSPAGSAGATKPQMLMQSSDTAPPAAAAAAPQVPAAAAPQAPAAAAAATPDAAVKTSDSASGILDTSAQTTALTPEQSAHVASQWKDQLKKDLGLTDDQAKGVVGSLWHESAGMNSGITQGGKIGEPNTNMADDNANGYGIAQWGGTRKQGLIDYAKQNGLPASSQAANYGFLKQELSGPYASVVDAVKATNDVPSSTAAFTNLFEEPSDPQMASRVSLAEQVV